MPTLPGCPSAFRGLGVGEPAGAGLVLHGGRPFFVRRLLFTLQCYLPGFPASLTPNFGIRTTLWRGPHGLAAGGSFLAVSGKTWTSNAANYTSYWFRLYSGTTLETLLWCFGLRIFRRLCEMVSDRAYSVSEGNRRGSKPRPSYRDTIRIKPAWENTLPPQKGGICGNL